jgi:hypothetical protein
MFAESIPWIVDYAEGSKIKIVGKGDTPVSVTSIPDIAGKLWTWRPAVVPNTIFLQGLSHTS